MQFCAIDARADYANKQLLGCSWKRDGVAGWSDDWQVIRSELVDAAGDGCTLVAHNSETHCALLFLANREHFKAHYINERWSYGQWWYGLTTNAVQVWDSLSLSGGMSITELAKAEGIALNDPPRQIRIRPSLTDPRVCFEHKRAGCWECFTETSRWDWLCDEHNRGECLECWQSRCAITVHSYMARYAAYMSGYGIRPRKSLGGAASALWRVLDRPKPCWLRNKRADAMARQGYVGPRVEAIKLGHVTDVYYADVHSMYPWVMSVAPMPDPISTECNESPSLDDRWIQYEGVTEATVTVPESYIPPLPLRKDGYLLFGVGQQRGVFTNVELRAAVQRGTTIDAVHAVTYSINTVHPFDTFTNGLLSYRDDLIRRGDPLEVVIKNVLNQLYGRLGLRSELDSVYIMPLPPGATDADWPNHEMLIQRDNVLMRKSSIRRVRDKYANPLWAATITGYARVRLLECMEAQGANLLYADTDSIVSSAPINGLGEGVGQLEHKARFDEGWIIAPKLYHLTGAQHGDKLAAAGVPKSFAKAYIHGQIVEWQRPSGILEAWNTDLYPGALRMVTPERRLMLSKRHVLNVGALRDPDGWTDTRPVTYAPDVDHIDQYGEIVHGIS